mgnify:FL=1
MERRNVLRLKIDCTLVIGLRLLIFVKFIPAKGSIIVCFKMLGIPLNRILVVLDGVVKLPLLPISKPSIVVKISFIRLDRDSFGEALDSIIIITFPVQRDAFVVVGVGVVRIYLDRLRVVLDSLLELAYLIVGEPSVKEGFKVVRHDLQSFRIILDSCLVVSFLSWVVALSVELLSFLLLLLIILLICWGVGRWGRVWVELKWSCSILKFVWVNWSKRAMRLRRHIIALNILGDRRWLVV